MLRLATESDPTFEPYSNICPITGHTQVEVENHQKNLIDWKVNTTSSPWNGIFESGNYVISAESTLADGNWYFRFTDANGEYSYTKEECGLGSFTKASSGWVYGGSTYQAIPFTVPNGCTLIEIGKMNADGTIPAQVEEGSTATAYEPYNGYQVTVNLGGTYYSGTLDVVSGVFTPDTAKYVLTDVSVLELYTTDTTTGSYAKIKTTEYPSIKEDVSSELASSCKVVAFADRVVDVHDNRFFINTNYVLIRASIDENVTTVNELFAIFENCEFILPLATPLTIQLSPIMVKALVGENHLSAPLEGQEITESKYKQTFTFDDVNAQIESTYSEGISHNSVYRGKYLGDHVTDEQWDAIGDGSFRDLYIGDYWTINGINWRIAHFNYWLGTGDVKCNTNHVVIVPYGWVSTFKMNASDDTTGGYLNSEWYTTNRHFAVENIEADFGASHILSHRNFFSDAVSDGHASHGVWVDSTVDLMNEIMVCGSLVGSYLGKYYEVGCDKFQLALFKYNPPSVRMDVSYWLRGVSTASSFVGMGNFGLLDGFTASQILRIRPVFGIKA